MAALARWLARLVRGPQMADVSVRVLTRADCPLCDDAWTFLESEQRRLGFTLTAVDIAGVPDLERDHGDWIPVVEIDGVIRFRGRINTVLWQRIVRQVAK